MDDQTRALVKAFDFPNLTYVGTIDESRALNTRSGPGIIIASSGMCEAGRILHHLKHHVRDSRTTVLLPGYQAANTLGRKIQNHWKEVPILGDMIPLNARVEMIDGLSAHADGKELINYVAPLRAGKPKVYLVHGEVEAAEAHKKDLMSAGFSDVTIPSRGDWADV
jgi:metallo-beta-lactamase family protein